MSVCVCECVSVRVCVSERERERERVSVSEAESRVEKCVRPLLQFVKRNCVIGSYSARHQTLIHEVSLTSKKASGDG